ncbi:hypothetical protein ACE1AT_21690 [Pelatocladus sp. BLCC-F211]|uniref:hypothetical protein n=1 Tax=Pelatocladus sp. BLCC-F211 TaxID=3342752 RepID=UPI0035BACE9A
MLFYTKNDSLSARKLLEMALMNYASPNKYILLVTEREMADAGATIFGCNLNQAKSKKHATAYLQKMAKYRKSIRQNNKNWVDIFIKSRGKYKFVVTADCVEGFCENKYIFSPVSVKKIQEYLSQKVYKTECCFDVKRGNAVLYARFTNWEDATEFASSASTTRPRVLHR